VLSSILKNLNAKIQEDSNLKVLLSGSAISLFLKVGGLLLGYFLIFLISKQTGAEGVGLYQIILKILTIVGVISSMGMNISVLRFIGQLNNDIERSKIHFLDNYIVRITLIVTVPVGIILFLNADNIIQWLGKENEYSYGLKLVGIILPFYVINQISIEFIRGFKLLKLSEFIRNVLTYLVMVIGIILIFPKDLAKIDLLTLLFIGIFISFISSRWIIRKLLKKIKKSKVYFDRKEFFQTSFPIMVTTLSTALFGAIPIFFLDHFTSQSEVGIYSVAYRLASTVTLVLVAVNTISAPKFAEMYWKGEIAELQKFINQSTKIIFYVSLILTITIILGGKVFLQIFGGQFVEGYSVLIILSIGQLINASTGSVGVFMNMSGRQGVLSKIFAYSSIFLLISLILVKDRLNMGLVSVIVVFFHIMISIIPSYILYKKDSISTFYIPFINVKKNKFQD